MSSTTKVTGMVSGFDTQSIIDAFMATSKTSLTRLENKQATEEVKLQAYQAVNTYILKFKSAVNALSTSSLWNSKATVSTNEKVMTATANEYAVNGSYSFKVAQLATATQYMSKGVASKTDPLVELADGETNYQLGSITLSSGKSRVDTSAELEKLNGGKGVYRGSVRITDASNNTATVDLSSCVTMDDVVQKLNEASGIQVNASLEEGRLVVADASGGTNTMKITNVGTGTTATDLGIVGSSVLGEDGQTQVVNGRNVYIMGNSTALSDLNDGLGVEEGIFYLRVSNAEGSYLNLGINTTGCTTVGDLVKKINTALETRSGENGDKYDEQGLMFGHELEGLTFGVSEDGTSFALTGTKAGYSYEFLGNDTTTSSSKAQPVLDLGLYDLKQTASVDGQEISFDRVLGGVNSPMLKNLSGANGTGIGTESDSDDNKKVVGFNGSTKLSSLNEGKGLDLSSTLQMIIYEGGANDTANGSAKGSNGLAITDVISATDIQNMIDSKEASGGATVDDLITLINTKLTEYSESGKPGAAALIGMSVAYDATTGGMEWKGAQAGYEYEVFGMVANSVGLQRNEATGTGSLGLPRGTTYDNLAIQDYTNGDKLAYGNEFIDTDTTMTDLFFQAAIPRYVDDGSGNEIDNPAYVKNAGTADEEFDLEAWKADCASVLATGKLVDGTAASGSYEDMFKDQKLSFTYTAADGVTTLDVEVEWNDVLAKLKQKDDGTGVDWSGVTVDSFLTAANEEIAAAFKAYNDEPTNTTYLATPTMSLNDNADGLGWTNMDFSKTTTISGSGFNGLDFNMKGATFIDPADGVEKAYNFAPVDESTDDINNGPANMAAAAAARPLCMEEGYYSRYETITAENASEHKLSELNLGLGMSLASAVNASSDPLYLELSLTDANGNTFTDANGDPAMLKINMTEVYNKLSNNGSVDINTKSVADYLAALNEVTETALADYKDTYYGGSATDAPSFKWGISDNGISMENVKNIDTVRFFASDETVDDSGIPSSALLGTAGLLTTGIGMGYGTGHQFIDPDSGEAKTSATVGAFNAVTYHESNLTGIGSIDISVGNYDKVTLSTDGISETSTLADLIDKLNSELAELANDASLSADERAAYADIRFVINDAGTGIAVDNTSNKTVTFHASVDDSGYETNNSLARDLGLIEDGKTSSKVAAYTLQSAGTLNRSYISRATKLDDWLDGGEKGTLEMTDATGRTVTVDCSECQTIGDMIDAINQSYYQGVTGIFAQLNEAGDGIDIIEQYNGGYWPEDEDRTTAISIKDQSSAGGVLAQKLGIAGTGVVETDAYGNEGYVLRGKLSKTIDVYANDSLQDVMYRISEAGYKAAIINDGTSATPFRLTISASSTGSANDFVIDSDIDLLGFNMTQKGKDAKVLYGDPNSNSSPVMLTSDTNTNSSAILGLTLNMTSTSDEWTTITVDTDKEKVTEAIKEMVTTYNDLINVISQLDGYDSETGEEGILFRDSNVRSLTDEMESFFYQIFDPKNLGMGGTVNGEQATWSWQDLGVTLEAVNTATDGSGSWYAQMILDEDKLSDMVASNWDTLQSMMHSETNVALATGSDKTKASASFNGSLAEGYDDATYAANGNSSKGTFGTANGIMANDTIENGANTYTLIFPQSQTVSRYSILHASKDTALSDYKVEYLNSVTGEWEELRAITGNTSDSNYMSVNPPVSMSGIRIVASATNAEDGKFRLLDLQVYSQTGLANQLNQYVNSIGDTTSGFLATQSTEIENNISELKSQMSSLQARLDAKEQNLWNKFTAMEVALSNLSNQSSYISSMLGSSSSSSSS